MKNLKKKLRSRAGETIAETLAALLIASIALTMLASMISSTMRMVTDSKEKMQAYYEAAEALEIMNTTIGGAASATPKTFQVKLTASKLSVSIPAQCYENTTFNNTDKAVCAYIMAP